MLGLVRLLAQPRVMGEGVLSATAAMEIYVQLSEWPGVGILAEPAGCEAAYRHLVEAGLPGRMLTDAYLAAFAQASRLRLVTFDSDFARFGQLERLTLA
jgi:predicted nucleic acid-binding protein